MIVTITPNTAIDRTLFVPGFELDRSIRASRSVIGMGGKATDASWILGELGIPSVALGFAAGPAGKKLEGMLEARGVEPDMVWVHGETRVNTVIVCEDGRGQSTISMDSLEVSPDNVRTLRERYRRSLDHAACVITGGSVPRGVDPSLHADFIREAIARGIPTILDASGTALQAGLEARPTLVKANRDELEEVVGRSLRSMESAYQAAKEIQTHYGCSVVATLGGQGALAILPGRAYSIRTPPVQVVSTAGAGDGVSAGLAASLSRGESLEAGLRLGFAAAIAVLLTPATADCRREDVERLLGQVRLVGFPESR